MTSDHIASILTRPDLQRGQSEATPGLYDVRIVKTLIMPPKLSQVLSNDSILVGGAFKLMRYKLALFIAKGLS